MRAPFWPMAETMNLAFQLSQTSPTTDDLFDPVRRLTYDSVQDAVIYIGSGKLRKIDRKTFTITGEMDVCIGIRTIITRGGRGFIQVGAGVVADSVPQYEFRETLKKAHGMISAVRAAGALS